MAEGASNVPSPLQSLKLVLHEINKDQEEIRSVIANAINRSSEDERSPSRWIKQNYRGEFRALIRELAAIEALRKKIDHLVQEQGVPLINGELGISEPPIIVPVSNAPCSVATAAARPAAA